MKVRGEENGYNTRQGKGKLGRRKCGGKKGWSEREMKRGREKQYKAREDNAR